MGARRVPTPLKTSCLSRPASRSYRGSGSFTGVTYLLLVSGLLMAEVLPSIPRSCSESHGHRRSHQDARQPNILRRSERDQVQGIHLVVPTVPENLASPPT